MLVESDLISPPYGMSSVLLTSIEFNSFRDVSNEAMRSNNVDGIVDVKHSLPHI